MAGTGITAINSLTGAAQTLVAGTSGTDFAVSSSGTAHTLNLPTASASNRGALSSADWSTFNGKQAALGYTPVSNALLINTTAPLTGGGDLSANRTLSIPAATSSINGYLSSTDWSTFNGRMQSIWEYRKTGRWYTAALFPIGTGGTITNFANSIRYIPFLVDRDITVTQLGINVSAIATAGTTCRLGIYSNNASTTAPNTRLVDTGTLALDTLGVKPSPTLSVSLTKGLYWLAYISNASTGTITSIPATSIVDVKGTTSIAALGVCAAVQSFTYGALPATASGLSDAAGITQPSIYYFW